MSSNVALAADTTNVTLATTEDCGESSRDTENREKPRMGPTFARTDSGGASRILRKVHL